MILWWHQVCIWLSISRTLPWYILKRWASALVCLKDFLIILNSCFSIIFPRRRHFLFYNLHKRLLCRHCFQVLFWWFTFGFLFLNGFLEYLDSYVWVAHRTLLGLYLLCSRQPLHQTLVVEKVSAAWYLSDLRPIDKDIHADDTFGYVKLVYCFTILFLQLDYWYEFLVLLQQRNMCYPANRSLFFRSWTLVTMLSCRHL